LLSFLHFFLPKLFNVGLWRGYVILPCQHLYQIKKKISYVCWKVIPQLKWNNQRFFIFWLNNAQPVTSPCSSHR
jgi:hypothetical protein